MKKLLILVCIALGAGIAAGYTWQSDREYSSSARVFVGLDVTDTAESDALYVSIGSTEDYADFARTKEVAALVTGRIGGGAEALAEAVDIDVVDDTTIIEITATDEDAQRARDIAAAYAEVVAAESNDDSGQQVDVIARVVDEPMIDTSSDSWPWWRNLALGAGAGLLVGLCLAGVRAVRATTP